MTTLPLLPEKTLTPEDEELERKKARLAELEAQLADRELELASSRADLAYFEKHYLQTVGRRYAILDDLKAKIAEARARQNPHKQDAREQARQARAKAQESARAAGEQNPQLPSPDDTAARKPNRSESLRNLFRQAAILLHPDRTLDGAEKEKRRRLMAEVNEAYQRGDEERIRAILRDWHASPESVEGDGPGAELVRVIRTIAQVEKRLKAIAAEMDQLRQGELFKLKQQVEEAQASGRDVLKDLGERLDREIAQTREELDRETTPVTPLSIGFETRTGAMVKAFERNTPVPITKKMIFKTAKDIVALKLYQGEQPTAAHNHLLGKITVEGIERTSSEASRVELTLNIDHNGILRISAEELGIGKQLRVRTEWSEGLSQAKVTENLKHASKAATP